MALSSVGSPRRRPPARRELTDRVEHPEARLSVGRSRFAAASSCPQRARRPRGCRRPTAADPAVASSEAPPSKTVSRLSRCRSGSSSASQDHSSVARSAAAPGRSRGPPVSSSSRCSRRSSSAGSGSSGRGRPPARSRAAARPDVRRWRRRPRGPRRQLRSALEGRCRARDEQRGGVRRSQRLNPVDLLGRQPRRAPGWWPAPSGSAPRPAARRPAWRRRGSGRSRRARATQGAPRAPASRTPSSAAVAATTPSADAASGTSTPASSAPSRLTWTAPAGKRGATARPASSAIRVLPTPPGPTRVTSRTSRIHEELADLGKLAVAADRRVCRRRQAAHEPGAGTIGAQRGVVREDHALEPPQLRPGLDAQLVDQQPATDRMTSSASACRPAR